MSSYKNVNNHSLIIRSFTSICDVSASEDCRAVWIQLIFFFFFYLRSFFILVPICFSWLGECCGLGNITLHFSLQFVAEKVCAPLYHIPLVPRVHWPVSGSHTCKVVVSVVGVLLSLTCFLFSLPVVQSVSGHHVLPNYLYSSHTVCCACKGLLLQQEAPQSSVPHYTAGAWRKCSWSYFLAEADLLMISISVFHCSRRIIFGHTHCLCWQITLPETRATCICIMRARLQEALSLM